MNEDDKKYNGFTHTFTWDADPEHMHPYTYNWATILADEIARADEQKVNLEWSESYLDLTDALINMMPSYPDAEEMIAQIQKNIA